MRCSASWPAIPADGDPFLQLPLHQASTDHWIVLNPEQSLDIRLRFKHQQTTTPRSAVAIHQKAAAESTTGTLLSDHPLAMGLKGLLEAHVAATGSSKASALLADWSVAKGQFKVLIPPSEREAMGLVDQLAVVA